jgi:hypothetical protein
MRKDNVSHTRQKGAEEQENLATWSQSNAFLYNSAHCGIMIKRGAHADMLTEDC